MSKSGGDCPLVNVLQCGLGSPNRPDLSVRQRQVINRILACGDGTLGAHIYRCRSCGKTHSVLHSCRDRHCPRCQYQQSRKWLQTQESCLLPVPYFHVVFTLPHRLNPLIRQNPKVALGLLFDVASSTLLSFFKNNLGAQPGLTAVLHTWGQTLCEHYHLHVLITGGGLSLSDDEWIEVSPGKQRSRWLFATTALAEVFRARYLEGLEQRFGEGKLEFYNQLSHWREKETFSRQLRGLSRQKWNVYCQAPFAGPGQVLRYLSCYTHRVAISPRRIETVDRAKGTVHFGYKDYANGESKTMTLAAEEFTRRFAQHILPKGFCKIRHYGILSTRNRRAKVAQCRYFLGAPPSPVERNNQEVAIAPVRSCPWCKTGELELVLIIGLTVTVRPGQQTAETSRRLRAPPTAASPR